VSSGGVVAGVAAVGAAACYAVCSVLQHRETGQVTESGLGLMWRLLHRPAFLVAVVVELAGLLLQAVALDLGAVIAVQPLLVTGLLFAVPLGAAVDHRRATGRELAGALACVAGLAAFLVAAGPAVGRETVSLREAAPLGGAIVAVAALLAAAGVRVPAQRGVFLAAAAGSCYGVSSAFFKVAADGFDHRGLAVLATWAPYALVAVGGFGLVLTQSAFQSGGLGAPLAVLTLAEPVSAVAFSRVVLQEHLAGGIGPRVAEIAAALVAAGGVAVLSSTPSARLRAPVA